jgi:hypothetical protein
MRGLPKLLGDERGIAGIALAIILGILSLLGISALGAINPRFVLMLILITCFLLGIVGTVFFRLPIQFPILIGLIAVAIVLFLEITPVVALGLMIAGFALWRVSPAKMPALFIGLLGIGCLMVFWGTKLTISLGVLP